MIDNLLIGFATAFSGINILYCFIGVFLGTLIGVLPGLGPMAAISMLLPITYLIGDPASAIIFISGVYYGTQYGGSTTSILIKLPGESSSVVTTLDGYAMTEKGRAGSALAIAAIGSFIAGTVATLLLAVVSKPLADVALMFGPAEYASLMVLGFLAAVALSEGSVIKGLGMVMIGILLGMIGTDVNSGVVRFSGGALELSDGISFAIIAMGMFGLAEIVYNILDRNSKTKNIPKVDKIYPSKEEIKESLPAIGRGTIIGSLLGLIPGTGAIISSFASYALEKKIKNRGEEFGKGNIRGVAAPESANNAAAQTSFIPALSLGIPTNPVMGLIIAALVLQGIQPGPQVIDMNSTLFWGLIVSMWLGNFFLLVLNLPLIGLWISVLKIPRYVLYTIIIVLCVIGTYYINTNWFSVWLLIPFTLLGYMFRKLDCSPAPLALGFVIGPLLEENLRRALNIWQGDWTIFLTRPLSVSILTIAVLILVGSIIYKVRNDRSVSQR